MKKNIYILLIFLFIVLLWTIFIFKYSYNKNLDKDILVVPTQKPSNVIMPSGEPLLEKSITWSIDKELLLKQQEEELKQKQKEIIVDKFNSAGETGKKELCDDIENKEEKILCMNNSYASKAMLENNSTYCKKISDLDWKNRCLDNYYYQLAIETWKQETCKSIIDSNQKNTCLSSIILNKIEQPNFEWWISICNDLTLEFKKKCQDKFNTQSDVDILQVSINSLSIVSCNKIKDLALKTKCEDVINLKIALNTKDINKCKLITEIALNTNCFDALNKINQ